MPDSPSQASASRSLTAGVDVGGTKIQTVVVSDEQVVGKCRQLTPETGDAKDVIAAIVDTVRGSLKDAGADQDQLTAVGIGIPGEIDRQAGSVSLAANVPGFSGHVALGPDVSKLIGGVEVVVDNDVRVGVLGEFHRGAGRPYHNVLGVWVGTGVGGGLVMDGQLYDGRGAAGEIGHAVVKPDGRLCSCGRRGCLEAYAGRARMERRARKLASDGRKTDLFSIMEERGRDRLSSGVYAQALKKSDKLAEELIKDATWALGFALASAQNVLDLEAIIVGGGLGDRLGTPFIDDIIEQMTPHLFAASHPPDVLPTELGDLSGAVGAAVLAGG